MTKECGVYKIINVTTGDFYVGSSCNIHQRHQHHRADLRANRHANQYLQRSWNKYGEEAFLFETILLCDKSTKLWFEQSVINGLKPPFNIAKDALAPMQGRKHTRKARKQMAESRSGERNGMYGKERPDLVKLNKSKENQIWTQERRDAVSERMIGNQYNAGRSLSEEHKEKLRVAFSGENNPNFGIPRTEEQKQMQREKMLGRKMSEETKRKMSEAQHRRQMRERGLVVL